MFKQLSVILTAMVFPNKKFGITDFKAIQSGKLNGVILYIIPIGSGNY